MSSRSAGPASSRGRGSSPPAGTDAPAGRRPKKWFTRFARATARTTGQPIAFQFAFGTIVLWIVSGPLFRFSDTWQLVINTGTTIVTFLMVFLIQNTQNRDSEALHVKLDGIISAMDGVENNLLDLEELEEDELDAIRDRYRRLAERARTSTGDAPDAVHP
ncbi:MAG: low affinity iron permease family protein [Gemmatimonadaceae bacterium]